MRARVCALAVARRARAAQDLGLVERLARRGVLRPVEVVAQRTQLLVRVRVKVRVRVRVRG